MFNEKELTSKDIYSCKIFDLKEHTVELDNGSVASRSVVYHHGGVCVAAFDEEDNILLVEQFRFPTGGSLLELPAGKLEKDEDPLNAGIRELEEETGYLAKSLMPLTVMYPTPAYCSEKIHIFTTSSIVKTHQHLDENELLEYKKVPFKEAVRMVLEGEIIDAKTQVAILMLEALRKDEE